MPHWHTSVLMKVCSPVFQITGALQPLNTSVHHIQSNYAEMYAGTVASQVLIGLHQPAPLAEVSSSLKNMVKRVYEVIDTDVKGYYYNPGPGGSLFKEFHSTWDFVCTTINYRITELLRLAKITKITQSNHQPIPTMPTAHVPQCHIHTALEHLQGRGLHHLPGQPVPLPHLYG